MALRAGYSVLLVRQIAMTVLTQRHVESLTRPVRDHRSASKPGGKDPLPSKWSALGQRLESLKASVEYQLGNRPAVTIAAGLALGVVIGWWLKRR
jgi:hypothetical protein